MLELCYRSKKIAAKIRAEVEEERKDPGNGKSGSYWGGSYSASSLNDLKKSQNTMPKYVTANYGAIRIIMTHTLPIRP